MEKNGRNSCTGNSRHIDARYFWVKDRVDKKELEIKYCPTDTMLADYFTKPLQGNLFRRLREVIMGWKHIDTLKDMTPPVSKERVEIPKKQDFRLIEHSDVTSPTEEREPTEDGRSVTYADIVQRERRQQIE